MITKVGKNYRLDYRPEGAKGKRVIRLFKFRADAVQFQQTYVSRLSDIQAVQANGDDRRLTDLIQLWFDLHGRTLKSATKIMKKLLRLSGFIGNPVAKLMNPELFATYRSSRLDSGISPSTLNRELITLKAVFRELRRLSVIDYDSSVLAMRTIREVKAELSYLVPGQVELLRSKILLSNNESLRYVFAICLVTGARWSEAENLKLSNCINQGFQFVDTKNGNSRFVPVSQHWFLYIRSRLELGRFKPCYAAYRSAFIRSGLIVPVGQLAHILRHTFASHFVMNGGNIVALQRILGHSSLNVTMRYSHLSPVSPDYLNQAIQFNPLAGINESGKKVES